MHAAQTGKKVFHGHKHRMIKCSYLRGIVYFKCGVICGSHDFMPKKIKSDGPCED